MTKTSAPARGERPGAGAPADIDCPASRRYLTAADLRSLDLTGRRRPVLVTLERYSFWLSGEAAGDIANRLPGIPVEQVGPIASRLIGRELVECISVFLVDAQRRVFGFAEVARGSVDSAPCSPADILRPALLAGASAVVICHNHPSGDPTASAADRGLTMRLREACALLDLALAEHLVVAGERCGAPWRGW
jgi:hypothetical protein